MRNVTAVLAVAVIAALTTASPAAADFDRPTKATSAKVHLVRAFAPCTTPNDVHNGIAALPACSPPTPLSTYTFGPAGKGSVQVTRKGFTYKLRFEVKDVRTGADQPVDNVTFNGRVEFSSHGRRVLRRHLYFRDDRGRADVVLGGSVLRQRGLSRAAPRFHYTVVGGDHPGGRAGRLEQPLRDRGPLPRMRTIRERADRTIMCAPGARDRRARARRSRASLR